MLSSPRQTHLSSHHHRRYIFIIKHFVVNIWCLLRMAISLWTVTFVIRNGVSIVRVCASLVCLLALSMIARCNICIQHTEHTRLWPSGHLAGGREHFESMYHDEIECMHAVAFRMRNKKKSEAAHARFILHLLNS